MLTFELVAIKQKEKNNSFMHMSILKTIIAAIIIIASANPGQACSCDRLYFCEYSKEPSKKIVIKASVGTYKEYSPHNTAIYLKVLTKFRDDVGISDVIKLYGSNNEASCSIDFRGRFPVGSTLYLAIGLEYKGEDVGHDIVNPDDVFEDFWEFSPSLCFTVALTIEDNRINGPIDPNFFDYPLNVFEENLANCNFSLSEYENFQCADQDFIVYPNPSEDGTISIGNSYNYSTIKSIQIYDTSGKLIYFEDLEIKPRQKTEITIPYSGLYIIAFTCSRNTFYKKVIVL